MAMYPFLTHRVDSLSHSVKLSGLKVENNKVHWLCQPRTQGLNRSDHILGYVVELADTKIFSGLSISSISLIGKLPGFN